jgi:hypothetical protein
MMMMRRRRILNYSRRRSSACSRLPPTSPGRGPTAKSPPAGRRLRLSILGNGSRPLLRPNDSSTSTQGHSTQCPRQHGTIPPNIHVRAVPLNPTCQYDTIPPRVERVM